MTKIKAKLKEFLEIDRYVYILKTWIGLYSQTIIGRFGLLGQEEILGPPTCYALPEVLRPPGSKNKKRKRQLGNESEYRNKTGIKSS